MWKVWPEGAERGKKDVERLSGREQAQYRDSKTLGGGWGAGRLGGRAELAGEVGGWLSGGFALAAPCVP